MQHRKRSTKSPSILKFRARRKLSIHSFCCNEIPWWNSRLILLQYFSSIYIDTKNQVKKGNLTFTRTFFSTFRNHLLSFFFYWKIVRIHTFLKIKILLHFVFVFLRFVFVSELVYFWHWRWVFRFWRTKLFKNLKWIQREKYFTANLFLFIFKGVSLSLIDQLTLSSLKTTNNTIYEH